MKQPPDYYTIEKAAKRIEQHINRTPVFKSENLNNLVKADIFFKCENFQKAGAFKTRGAVNAIFSFSNNEIINGVCTHSSGNHAAALARAAMLRKTKAYIVMPENSSHVKIEAVRNYNGIITFCKPNLKSREETLKKVKSKTKAIEIHPYNNFSIIAGQATAAKEFYEEVNDLDIIMAPVGGGGLLSGTALTTHYISPETKVIAAEPAGADDAYRSFYTGKFIPSENPNTIADGLLTSLGSLTYPIIQKYVHQIVTVSENVIIKAMRLIWERMKIIIEPSAAVPFAAILENKFDYRNQRIGIIISGGNIDLDKIPWLNNTVKN
ncbi:MAG: pyridoxal-phosphate dependent enzyme [Bacteroidetes bacterium]|nr:pyridoxal-phosphate dependent enzyme [Bacteroidota bacterium]MBL7103611.1 pyridoxal-phosphate dependent enzyme [Bacteroidales bacterium]